MADANSPEDIVRYENFPQLLDFSTLKFKTREEFQNALSKIPDLRMRPEKVRDSEACQNYAAKKKNKSTGFPFPNPIPTTLQLIRMEELSQVDIDWKMLTLVRPKTKQEEDVFTKIVEMERKKLKTIISEAGVIDNLRKKPHISICARDDKGNQEIYRYHTYAREKNDNALEEDKSADYIQQVAEMLSTSKLKGDYTKEIVKKKMKSRNREEKWQARLKEKEKNKKKKLNELLKSASVTGVTSTTDNSFVDGQCPNENLQDDTEKKIRSFIPASTTRTKTKFKKLTKKLEGHEAAVP